MSEYKEKHICIIDFESGNIASISNVLEKLKLNYCISNKNEDIEKATHLILPGVGSFAVAMTKLKKNIDLSFLEKEVLVKKKPILGICVGMQIMADVGNEFGSTKGLGWIEGSVDLIDSKGASLPHIGWNEVKFKNDNNFFDKIETGHDFYFVNSYYFNLKNSGNMIASTEYGIRFPSAINKENLFGVQFHPEKSQKFGRQLILNFIKKT